MVRGFGAARADPARGRVELGLTSPMNYATQAELRSRHSAESGGQAPDITSSGRAACAPGGFKEMWW